MIEIIQGVLEILEQYFVYIYPGIISLFIGYFSKARGFSVNKMSISLSVVISYIYLIFYRQFRNIPITHFTIHDHLILVIIAIIAPLLLYWITRSKIFRGILRLLKINTTIEDNAWDYLEKLDKKNDGIVVKLFLDDLGIMYEGSLRYKTSITAPEHTICLSGYRRYQKENDRYIVKVDHGNDHKYWTRINLEDVTRTEVIYSEEK